MRFVDWPEDESRSDGNICIFFSRSNGFSRCMNLSQCLGVDVTALVTSDVREMKRAPFVCTCVCFCPLHVNGLLSISRRCADESALIDKVLARGNQAMKVEILFRNLGFSTTCII